MPRIRRFTREAWRELPFETGAVATVAISLILAVERVVRSSAGELWLARLILAALVATPLLFSLTLLARAGRLPRAARLSLSAAVAAGCLGAMILGLRESSDIDRSWFLWPYGFALIAAVLVPFVTTALAAGRAREVRFAAFDRFLRRFCEQTTGVVILGAAALAAVGVVFMALSELFDLKVDELAIDACLLVVAVFTVGYLYQLLSPGDGDRVPELWRRLVTGVGVPFVAVMLAILAVYELYVLATGEMPRNLLSPLIIGAGAVGFVCTLIMAAILRDEMPRGPLAPAEPHRWTKHLSIRVVRAFPLGLLALLPMAGWALVLRIEQYGFTPFRVGRMLALLCLGTLALLGSIRYLRGRRALSWEVPLCCIAFALAGLWGPAGAVRLSVESQVPRLERMLTEAGVAQRVIHAEAPPEETRVPDQTFEELASQIGDVYDLGGEAALRRVFRGELSRCADRWLARQCLERLGVVSDQRLENRWRYGVADVQGSFAIPWQAGADATAARPAHLSFVNLGEGVHRDAGGAYTLRLEANQVHCHRDGVELGAASLEAAAAEALYQDHLSPTPIAIRDRTGTAVGLLMIQVLRFARTPDDRPRITSLEGTWLAY